jgi:hypothetical protein
MRIELANIKYILVGINFIDIIDSEPNLQTKKNSQHMEEDTTRAYSTHMATREG